MKRRDIFLFLIVLLLSYLLGYSAGAAAGFYKGKGEGIIRIEREM
jgi:hypothetical protein